MHHVPFAKWEGKRLMSVHDRVRFTEGIPVSTEEGSAMAELPEMSEKEAHEMWQGLMEAFALAPGVHYLDYDSYQTLSRARAKAAEAAARFVKHVP
jgi:hypothetical protein